jgi:hypothetical protein
MEGVMKNLFGKLSAFVVLSVLVCGPVFASVNVQTNGADLGPAQEINFVGVSASGKGPIKTVDLSSITTTMTVSSVDTIGWTVISSANTFGTTTCANACVFCIASDVTVADIVGCNVTTADKCLCAGGN